MAIPLVLSAIGGFVADIAKKLIVSVASDAIHKLSDKKKDKTTSSPSLTQLVVKQDERIINAEIGYYKAKATRESELVNIQSQLYELNKQKFVADLKIAQAQAVREEQALWLSEQNLQVRRQELDLARQNLEFNKELAETQRKQVEQALALRERELQLMEDELTERRKLSYLYLEFLREKQASEITLRLSEIQANFDLKNWSGVLSREEIQKILLSGQQQHRLLLLVSPPEISRDCPDTFVNNLQLDVQSDLKAFIEQHYPLHSDECPVEFFGKFFQHAIFDTQVKQLESLLSPMPTAILYSTVTDEKMSLHVRLWGLARPLSLTMAWMWEREFEHWVTEGKTEKDSFRLVRQSIVKIHQVVAAFLADLYYLQINPHHSPRVWDLTEEFSMEWLRNQFVELRQLQIKRQADSQKEMEILAAQQMAAKAEEELKKQAEERQREIEALKCQLRAEIELEVREKLELENPQKSCNEDKFEYSFMQTDDNCYTNHEKINSYASQGWELKFYQVTNEPHYHRVHHYFIFSRKKIQQ
jgi:hypothetical protein